MTAHMFLCFSNVFFFFFQWQEKSKWSPLIFLMAGPLSWLLDLVESTVLTTQVTMPVSIHSICSHTIRAAVQFHCCNYQSAPQPPNWGIHLNSVKWHFTDRGLSCARLWIKVIPQGLGGRVCLGTRGGVFNHSFKRTWLGAGTSKQNNHKNRFRIVADAASFLSDKNRLVTRYWKW